MKNIEETEKLTEPDGAGQKIMQGVKRVLSKIDENEEDLVKKSEEQKYGRNKIFNLRKMIKLLKHFSKLKNKYDEYLEKYEKNLGYHFNEIILAMVYLFYVRTNDEYFKQYKKLKVTKDDPTKFEEPDFDDGMNEITSAGGMGASYSYSTPKAWSKDGDLMGDKKSQGTIKRSFFEPDTHYTRKAFKPKVNKDGGTSGIGNVKEEYDNYLQEDNLEDLELILQEYFDDENLVKELINIYEKNGIQALLTKVEDIIPMKVKDLEREIIDKIEETNNIMKEEKETTTPSLKNKNKLNKKNKENENSDFKKRTFSQIFKDKEGKKLKDYTDDDSLSIEDLPKYDNFRGDEFDDEQEKVAINRASDTGDFVTDEPMSKEEEEQKTKTMSKKQKEIRKKRREKRDRERQDFYLKSNIGDAKGNLDVVENVNLTSTFGYRNIMEEVSLKDIKPLNEEIKIHHQPADLVIDDKNTYSPKTIKFFEKNIIYYNENDEKYYFTERKNIIENLDNMKKMINFSHYKYNRGLNK